MSFDFNKPFRTRNGLQARLLGILESNLTNYPVIVAVKDEEGNEEVVTISRDGKYSTADSSEYDLFHAVETFVNIYPAVGSSHSYQTREEAEAYRGTNGFTVRLDSLGNVEVIGKGLTVPK